MQFRGELRPTPVPRPCPLACLPSPSNAFVPMLLHQMFPKTSTHHTMPISACTVMDFAFELTQLIVNCFALKVCAQRQCPGTPMAQQRVGTGDSRGTVLIRVGETQGHNANQGLGGYELEGRSLPLNCVFWQHRQKLLKSYNIQYQGQNSKLIKIRGKLVIPAKKRAF